MALPMSLGQLAKAGLHAPAPGSVHDLHTIRIRRQAAERTQIEGGGLPRGVAQQRSAEKHKAKCPEVQVEAVVGGDRKEAGVLADQIRKIPREASRDGRIRQHVLQNQIRHSQPAGQNVESANLPFSQGDFLRTITP